MAKARKKANSLVVVSDTHCGCRLGLFPPGEMMLDGHPFVQSKFQAKTWAWWEEFWGEYVPSVVHNEPYDVVFNGDALDGVHHKSVYQITHNLMEQRSITHEVLGPVAERCRKSGGTYYHIRGTEAHVGQSAQEEEELAKGLGAKPNAEGMYARWDLWKMVGSGLVHLLHHIGTTGSQAYEATAVHKELTEEFAEAARWRDRPPDVIVRSHRHRCIKTAIPVESGEIEQAQAVVTPGWQGKTPFVWKLPGGRLSRPQFGGIIIRQHEGGVLFVRTWVRTIERSPTE